MQPVHQTGKIATALRVLLACLLVVGVIAQAEAQVRVRGYTKKNGTYVAPHYRSSPNRSKSDNYSSRGNYNPYTGARGTVNSYPSAYPNSYTTPAYPRMSTPRPAPAVDPGSPTSSLSWTQYRPQPVASPLSPPVHVSGSYAPAAPPALQVTSVFRCEDAQGNRHYLSYPRAGCVEILALSSQPSAAQPRQLLSYGGYVCTSDCSGHQAGYQWAEDHGIDDPDDCGGNSQSFIEGCETYAEEQQDE